MNVKYSDCIKSDNIVLLFLSGKASIEVCGYSKIRISGGEAVFLSANSEWTLLSESPCQISSLYYRESTTNFGKAYLKYLMTDFRKTDNKDIHKLIMCEAMSELSLKIKDNILEKKNIYKIVEQDYFTILKTYYTKEEVVNFLYPYLIMLYQKERKNE